MAKNTKSSAYRQVDVDQYTEDSYIEDADDNAVNGTLNENELRSMLANGRSADALKHLIANPVKSKDLATKDQSAVLAVKVLTSFKPAEMEKFIESLADPEVDTLMKYIYKGFQFPADGSSAQLLTWHQKAFNRGGSGSVVRVLTDRKF